MFFLFLEVFEFHYTGLYDLTRLYIDAAFRGSTPAFRAAMAADLDSDLHLHWRAHDLPHHQYLDAVFAVFSRCQG